jgi:hypothetical protein
MREIKIEYLDLQSDDVANGILGETFAPGKVKTIKERALDKLGIQCMNATPLNAWLKHLSDLNDLPFTKPLHKDIVDAIQDNITAFRFMFWLA